MKAEILDSINKTAVTCYLRAKKQASLTFNQYVVLVRLHVTQLDPQSYEELRTLVGIEDRSDFNKIVVKPLTNAGYVFAEQKAHFKPKDIFITKKGSQLVEKISNP